MGGVYGFSFNATTGIEAFTFRTEAPECGTDETMSWTFPTGQRSDEKSGLVPAVIIPGASIVANITHLQDFNGNITFTKCTELSDLHSNASYWKPQLGELIVIQGQCMTFGANVGTVNCRDSKLEMDVALIGDFCARSPDISICKNHDPKVTIPPALRATGGGASSGTVSANRQSMRRAVLTSLAACLAAVVASL